MSKLVGLITLLGLFGAGCGVSPALESPPVAAASAAREPARAEAQPDISRNGWCILQYQDCAGGADPCDKCICKNQYMLCITPPGHLIDCTPECDAQPF
jgi:hypothetical protein